MRTGVTAARISAIRFTAETPEKNFSESRNGRRDPQRPCVALIRDRPRPPGKKAWNVWPQHFGGPLTSRFEVGGDATEAKNCASAVLEIADALHDERATWRTDQIIHADRDDLKRLDHSPRSRNPLTSARDYPAHRSHPPSKG
jgi:hypothetical protein